jgi:hypothetical protein
MVQNVIQCLLCNSSIFHYLEPLRKGVIEKMTYLIELCLILESELVEHATHENNFCMDLKIVHIILQTVL